MDEKILVSLSGGMDSATMTAMAIEQYGRENVSAVVINYGQTHQREIRAALNLAAHHFKIPCEMKVLGIGNFTGGAILGTPSGEHDEMHSYAPPGSQVAPSWVPARNAIILSALAGLAYTRGIYIIGTGVNAVDWSGYFDCRPGFITRLEDALAWALGYEHSYPGFAIYAPLIQLSKKEIVEEGERLHVPWGMTWSCYEGKEKPCQKCGACKVRKIGFDAAGVVDPLLSTS